MKSIWDTEELANHWSLSFEEIQLLKSKPNRNGASKKISAETP